MNCADFFRVGKRQTLVSMRSIRQGTVSHLRSVRFWTPTIIGALLTPVCFYLIVNSPTSGAAGHAGAGLGALMIIYPLPLLILMRFAGNSSGDAFRSQIISALAFGGMILQFPLYGFLISYANLKQSFWLKTCATLAILHVIAIVGLLAIYLIQTLL